jgi:hypothetical protein
MSDFAGLTALSFFFLTAILGNFYIANSANDLGAQILTGVIRGAPISVGARRALLYQMWLGYQGTAVAVDSFCALAAMQFAHQVDDSNAKLLAYLAAFIAAAGSLFFLNNGIFGVRNYGRMLRRIEQK